MKLRYFLLSCALVFALIVTLGSCVKTYNCVCTIAYSGYPGLPDTVTQQYNISNTKSSAQSTCQNNSGTYTNNGIKTVETCVLQ